MIYEVYSVPMIFYFKNGKKKFEYHGETNSVEAFIDFIAKYTFYLMSIHTWKTRL